MAAATPPASWHCPECGGTLTAEFPRCPCRADAARRRSAAAKLAALDAARKVRTDDARLSLLALKSRILASIESEVQAGIRDPNPFRVTAAELSDTPDSHRGEPEYEQARADAERDLHDHAPGQCPYLGPYCPLAR